MREHELTLDELLNEPIIRQVMVADGYEPNVVRLLMRMASARANGDDARHLTSSSHIAKMGITVT